MTSKVHCGTADADSHDLEAPCIFNLMQCFAVFAFPSLPLQSLTQGKAADDHHDDSDSNGLIKARHGNDSQTALDECLETPEEIASKFDGTCKRLSAGAATMVYWKSGGMAFGLLSLFVFAFTQTTRIIGDWWIR